MRISNRAITLIVSLGAFTWVGLVAAMYYAGHKPFSPELALAVVSAGWKVLAALAILSLAGGLGRRLLPWVSRNGSGETAVGLAVQAAAGTGLLALLILALGVVVGLSFWTLAAFSTLVGAMVWRSVWAWWQEWLLFLAVCSATSRYERALQAGVFTLLTLSFCVALAPPLRFDTLVYHLALPQAYLAEGRVSYQPENMFWGMPQTGEMIFTWAAGLAGYPAAAVAGWAFGVLAVLGVFGFTAGRWGRAAGWTAVAALLAGPTFASSLSWAYVDWLQALFGLACLALLDEWRRGQGCRALAWAGILAGMTLGAKYSGGVALLAGGTVILIGMLRAGSVPGLRLVQNLLWFGMPAVGISLPWWIKNYLATGNPFYPFLFPGGAMNALRLELYQGMPPWGDWWEAALLPLRATTHGFEGGAGYSASIGPLLLALAPFAALMLFRLGPQPAQTEADRRRKDIFVPAVFGLAGLLVWAGASRLSGLLIQTRLYFSIFPALAALAGAGFAALDDLRLPELRLGRVIGALVLMALGLNTLQMGTAVLQSRALLVILAQESEQAYLQHNLGYYPMAAAAIKNLSSDAQVLMLWEPRSLYCQPGPQPAGPTCEPDEVIDRWLVDRRQFESEDRILQAWRAQGFTHMLLFRWGADFVREDDRRYTSQDWEVLERLLASLPAAQAVGEAYELYPLNP